MEEDNIQKVSEPAATMLSEEVRRSGLLSQVMKLSQPDKVALIKYLNNNIDREPLFQPDEFGKIKLTSKMRAAVAKAERDLEEGRCLTEESFRERFAKWL